MEQLRERQEAVLRRCLRLEVRRLRGDRAAAEEAWGVEQEDLGVTHRKLRAALEAKRVPLYRFCRVPSDYYDRTQDERRGLLGASSVSLLCKTIALCNKEASPDAPDVDVEAPLLSRYLLVIVQYDRRFEVERLRNHVVEYSKACGRPVSKSKLNYRLADDCKALTGFTHGGVTPVGSSTPLPVVLDARIAALRLFWLGAGDVDLKLCLRTSDFVQAYSPIVLECT